MNTISSLSPGQFAGSNPNNSLLFQVKQCAEFFNRPIQDDSDLTNMQQVIRVTKHKSGKSTDLFDNASDAYSAKHNEEAADLKEAYQDDRIEQSIESIDTDAKRYLLKLIE